MDKDISFIKELGRSSKSHSFNIFIFSKCSEKSFLQLPSARKFKKTAVKPFFRSSVWGCLTDVDFYQLYEASSRLFPPSQSSKLQPMRAPLFQPAVTKGRRERVLADVWDYCPIGGGRSRRSGGQLEMLGKWRLVRRRRKFCWRNSCYCRGLASSAASFRLQVRRALASSQALGL